MDDSDRRVRLLVLGVEREQPDRHVEQGVACCRDGPGGEVHELEEVDASHPGYPSDPRSHFRRRRCLPRVRTRWHDVFATRDGGGERNGTQVGYGSTSPNPVHNPDRCARRDGANVHSSTGEALGQGILAWPLLDRAAVDGRTPSNVGKRCRRLVVDHDFVCGHRRPVRDGQLDCRLLADAKRTRSDDALVEAQPSPERRPQHCLHVENDRLQRASRHRGACRVGEEQNA